MENQKEATITFYVAGCMEFTTLRECYEDLTLEQAVETYQKIRDRNRSYGCGIGFTLHDPQEKTYSDLEYPLYQCKEVAKDAIDLIPAFKNHPLVQKAMEDIQKLDPEREKEKKEKPKKMGRKKNTDMER